jgi:hypothetical protein
VTPAATSAAAPCSGHYLARANPATLTLSLISSITLQAGWQGRKQTGANPCGWGAHELGSLYVPLCQIVQARLSAQQPRLLP